MQLLYYVLFFDISYHYGVIVASLICSVEKVLCRLTEQIFFFFYLTNGEGGHLPKPYSTTTYFIYLQILHYKGDLLPLLLLHPFCIIHSILKTITHVFPCLYVLPEHPPQSQYNAILQLFDAVYFLFLLCKEWQSEEEKKTDGIASMQ